MPGIRRDGGGEKNPRHSRSASGGGMETNLYGVDGDYQGFGLEAGRESLISGWCDRLTPTSSSSRNDGTLDSFRSIEDVHSGFQSRNEKQASKRRSVVSW